MLSRVAQLKRAHWCQVRLGAHPAKDLAGGGEGGGSDAERPAAEQLVPPLAGCRASSGSVVHKSSALANVFVEMEAAVFFFQLTRCRRVQSSSQFATS